jgi:type IV pilus assembly protein PilY1
MHAFLRSRWLTLMGGALLAAGPSANAVTIAETPLFVSGAVAPNVMLVIDNSGSMRNVIWATGFNTAVTYTDWSRVDNGASAWTGSDSDTAHSDLLSSTWRTSGGGIDCPAGSVRGKQSSGTTRCLTLPDPAGGGGTRWAGNYLNYLFSNYGTNNSVTPFNLSTGAIIPNTYRFGVAKSVASTFVTNNPSLRIGLSSFWSNEGGKIDAACGTTAASLQTTITNMAIAGSTPLAEAYYEITRYFRGMTGYFNEGTYTSPIQYRCQKNFVIMITDGYPTRDENIPTDDAADTADSTRSLPNWDGKAPATTAAQYPNFPQYSDGFKPSGSAGTEGYSLYLDDLTKFGNDIDLKTTGNDLEGGSYSDPAFPKQNLITYTIGFTVANQMLIDAAAYGKGNYYTASNAAQLTTALAAAVADIKARTSTVSSVTSNSTRLTGDSLLYQAEFSTTRWAGGLLAYPLLSGGALGSLEWNAADLIPDAGSRNILTYNPTAAAGSRGRTFLWASLTAAQQAELNKNIGGVNDGRGQARLDYLRGDQSNEAPSGLQFRTRDTVLGDIINSDPAFVGAQNYGFSLLPGSEGSSYKSNRPGRTAANRPTMVYVASNDGMLHGFDGDTGVERLAYMPNAVYSELTFHVDPSYDNSHRYINDGSPWVLDAYLGSSWQTILVGSLGLGGKGIYALNVTDPAGFDTGDVMWEFTSADDSDLGDSMPQPAIARLSGGKWVAIVSNGYNSAAGLAKLFVLDLETGAKLAEISTGVGGDNGLASPTPVDVDGDRIADYVYAGDLKGNMWKFDLTSTTASNWKTSFGTVSTPIPLYTACNADPCTAANRQPITSRPEVGKHPIEGSVLYFGTGKYFATGDNAASGIQTFYAIRDRNGKQTVTPAAVAAGRANLQAQTVIYENSTQAFFQLVSDVAVQTNVAGVRVTSANTVADSKDGWFINLPATGERQVSSSVLRNGKIVFTTIIPGGDACSAGGEGWLMVLDALTGGRPEATPLDLNLDGTFDRQDFITVTIDGEQVEVPATGVKSEVGMVDQMLLVSEGDGESDIYKACGTNDGAGCDGYVAPTGQAQGRQSWREVD